MVHVHLRQRLPPLIYLNPEVSSIKLYLPLLRSLVVCETPVSPSNMALVESEVDSVAELKKLSCCFNFIRFMELNSLDFSD